jgi:hypothetical protein
MQGASATFSPLPQAGVTPTPSASPEAPQNLAAILTEPTAIGAMAIVTLAVVGIVARLTCILRSRAVASRLAQERSTFAQTLALASARERAAESLSAIGGLSGGAGAAAAPPRAARGLGTLLLKEPSSEDSGNSGSGAGASAAHRGDGAGELLGADAALIAHALQSAQGGAQGKSRRVRRRGDILHDAAALADGSQGAGEGRAHVFGGAGGDLDDESEDEGGAGGGGGGAGGDAAREGGKSAGSGAESRFKLSNFVRMLGTRTTLAEREAAARDEAKALAAAKEAGAADVAAVEASVTAAAAMEASGDFVTRLRAQVVERKKSSGARGRRKGDETKETEERKGKSGRDARSRSRSRRRSGSVIDADVEAGEGGLEDERKGSAEGADG